MLYPLTFRPIFKERLWGSRTLESLYGKALPPHVPIGESWEVTDRPEGVSVIDRGPLAGKDLRWLVENHGPELMGNAPLLNGRFPILAKILDAQAKLSLQVHPPAPVAPSLNGEPKTEIWYVADARPGAELYVGLKRGVTREEFRERLKTGVVADCFHRVSVRLGDAMFVPSGRVHGIGAGCVIFEIQQSSDTTYRVFDWNRIGPDGKGRELHIPQSLASIDFNDFEPALVPDAAPGCPVRPLVSCPYFDVELRRFEPGATASVNSELLILAVTRGDVQVTNSGYGLTLRPGDFCLLPAALRESRILAITAAEVLVTRPK
jgi:mannose-6-phosphate isomerase